MKAKSEPDIWDERLAKLEGDPILVGHMPHLSRLAALLLTSDADKEVVDFTNAGIVCLKQNDDNKWKLTWAVRPEFF